MRFVPIAVLAVMAGVLPAYAQDRTPPAGSYRALEVPVDQTLQVMPTVRRNELLSEGRSADVGRHNARRPIDR